MGHQLTGKSGNALSISMMILVDAVQGESVAHASPYSFATLIQQTNLNRLRIFLNLPVVSSKDTPPSSKYKTVLCAELGVRSL